MSSPPPEYWSSVAQLVPFLALALIVEWRAMLRSRAGDESPWYLRAILSLFWGLSLVLLGLSEFLALRALREGEAADWWPGFIGVGLGASIGVLVFSPAIELVVRTSPEVPAILLSRHPILRYKRRRIFQKTLRRIRVQEHRLKEARASIAANDELLSAARNDLDHHKARLDALTQENLSDSDQRERAALEAELTSALATLEAREAQQEEVRSLQEAMEAELTKVKVEILADYQESTERMHELLAKDRLAWQEVLRSHDELDRRDSGARRAEKQDDEDGQVAPGPTEVTATADESPGAT